MRVPQDGRFVISSVSEKSMKAIMRVKKISPFGRNDTEIAFYKTPQMTNISGDSKVGLL